MRSATTKRSVGGLVAFVLGLVITMVIAVGAVALSSATGGDQRTFPPAAPSGSASAVAGGGSDTLAPAGEGELNVTEKDFAIALSSSTVKAGSVKFNIKNNGPSPHNIEVKELNKASDNIDSGKTGTLTVDLKAGTYTIICNIPGHEQLGMKVMLTVQ